MQGIQPLVGRWEKFYHRMCQRDDGAKRHARKNQRLGRAGHRAKKVSRVIICFSADGLAALRAHVIVLVAARQHEQQLQQLLGVARRQRRQKSDVASNSLKLSRGGMARSYTARRPSASAPMALSLHLGCV